MSKLRKLLENLYRQGVTHPERTTLIAIKEEIWTLVSPQIPSLKNTPAKEPAYGLVDGLTEIFNKELDELDSQVAQWLLDNKIPNQIADAADAGIDENSFHLINSFTALGVALKSAAASEEKTDDRRPRADSAIELHTTPNPTTPENQPHNDLCQLLIEYDKNPETADLPSQILAAVNEILLPVDEQHIRTLKQAHEERQRQLSSDKQDIFILDTGNRINVLTQHLIPHLAKLQLETLQRLLKSFEKLSDDISNFLSNKYPYDCSDEAQMSENVAQQQRYLSFTTALNAAIQQLLVYQSLNILVTTYHNHLQQKNVPAKLPIIETLLPSSEPVTPKTLQQFQQKYTAIDKTTIQPSRSLITPKNIAIGWLCFALPGLIMTLCAIALMFKSRYGSSKQTWNPFESHGALFCKRMETIFAQNSEIFPAQQITVG